MIPLTLYKGKTVGVFGLGRTGMATVASLIVGGAEVMAWDDSEESREKCVNVFPPLNLLPLAGGVAMPLPLAGGERGGNVSTIPFSQWPWERMECLVPAPGVALTHPTPHPVVAEARKHHCPIVGDVELLHQAYPNVRKIAITGTNGKSTTTTLVGHLLREAGFSAEIGGNLGTPALALNLPSENGCFVLELSSYQLDLLHTARFNIAVLLNITPDHLDRHGDMQHYIAAKRKIFDRQQKDDVAIIAIDDEHSRGVYEELVKEGKRRVIAVSGSSPLYAPPASGGSISHPSHLREGKGEGMRKAKVYVKNGILHDELYPENPILLDLNPIITLTGRHNWQNAAAAYAAARCQGLSPEMIAKHMKTFPGLKHRMELVATIDGVRFINDSKATNADAASNALAAYETIYWIAGGKPKAGGIESLMPYFDKIAHAFLIGEAEEEFARTLEGKVEYTRCGTLDKAVEEAAAMAFAAALPPLSSPPQAGGIDSVRAKKPLPLAGGAGGGNAVILLSPACASFDQWRDFEARGEAFGEMVKKIRN